MKLHLPKALIAALMMTLAQTYALTVTSTGEEKTGSFDAGSGYTANGVTYTVSDDGGLITSGYGIGTSYTVSVKFNLDLDAVADVYNADGLQGYRKLIWINRQGAAGTWWGYDITDTGSNNGTGSYTVNEGEVVIAGHWSGDNGPYNNANNAKYDIASLLVSGDGSSLGTLSLLATLSCDPDNSSTSKGTNLTNGDGTAITGATNMRQSGLVSTANNKYVNSISLSSTLIDTVEYTYQAQQVTNASGTWSKTYETYWTVTAANSTVTSSLPSGLEGILVTGGSLNVTADAAAGYLTTNNTCELVVGGSGQLVITGAAEGTLSLPNAIVLGSSTHANATTQGALYLNNADGAITLAGNITLIEDSTIGAAGNANAVTFSGAVTGAYNLSIVSGGNISFAGGLNVDSLTLNLNGRSSSDTSALISYSGNSGFSITDSITLTNYADCIDKANGRYKLMALGDQALAQTMGAKVDLDSCNSTHNRVFSYEAGDDGMLYIVTSDAANITIDSDTAWSVTDDQHDTSAVVVTSGYTLTIGNGGAHADYAGNSYKYGSTITVENDATLTLHSWAYATSTAVDISETNKVIIQSQLVLEDGAHFKTSDGSYFYEEGVVVDGNADITHQYGKGHVYGAINAGANATNATTLTFTHTSGENGIVVFSREGNFAGKVVLEMGNNGTQKYIINHSSALQNAHVDLSGSPELRLNVASASIAALTGTGSVLLNGNEYGADGSVAASTLTITGHGSTGDKVFSGTIGGNVAISVGNGVSQGFNNITFGSGASLSLGDSATLSGTLTFDISGRNTAVTATGALGTISSVELATLGNLAVGDSFTLMNLASAADAQKVVDASTTTKVLTSFATASLVAEGSSVNVQAGTTISDGSTVTLDEGVLVVSNNDQAYQGTYNSATHTAELTFSQDTGLNLTAGTSNDKTFTATNGNLTGSETEAELEAATITVTLNTLTLNSSTGTLTIQGSNGAKVEGTLGADFYNANLTLGDKVSLEVSETDNEGRLEVGGAKTLTLLAGSSLSVEALRLTTSGGNGTVIINGGTLTVNGDNNEHSSNTGKDVSLNLNHYGSKGTLELQAGTLCAKDAVMFLKWDGSGAYTQSGGTAYLKGISAQSRNGNSAADNNKASVSLTGGTLYLGSEGLKYINGNFTLGNVTIISSDEAGWITDKGAGTIQLTATGVGTATTIDTNGHDVTINHALGGGGNLVKDGAGTLTLNETATAALTLKAGTLTLAAGKTLTSLTTAGTSLALNANGATVTTVSVEENDSISVSGTLNTGSFTLGQGATLTLTTGDKISVAENGTLALNGTVDLTGYALTGAVANTPFAISGTTAASLGAGFTIKLSTDAANVATTGDTNTTGLIGSTASWILGTTLGIADKSVFMVDGTSAGDSYSWDAATGTLRASSYVYNIAASGSATANDAYGDQSGADRTGVLFQSGASLTGVSDTSIGVLPLISASGVTDASVTLAGTYTVTPTNLAQFSGTVNVGTDSVLAIGTGANASAFGTVTLSFSGGTLKYNGGDVASMFSSSSNVTFARTGDNSIKVDIGEYNDTWGDLKALPSLEILGTTGTLRLEGTNQPSIDNLIISGGTVKLVHAKALKMVNVANHSNNATNPTIATTITLKGGTLEFTSYNNSNDGGGLAASVLSRYTYMISSTLTADLDSGKNAAINMGTESSYGNGIGLAAENALTYKATNNGGTLTINSDISGFGDVNAADRKFNIADSTATTEEVVINGLLGRDSQNDGQNITIVKLGAGTLKINGANNTPGLTVREGTVIANNAQALGKDRALKNIVTVGDSDTPANGTATLDLYVGNTTAVSQLLGNTQGVITSSAATAQTLKIGSSADGVEASAFHGKVTSNVNLEIVANSVTFDGDLSAFNGNVTVSGGNLTLANSKADSTLNIGTLDVQAGAGTTTISCDTEATNVKIANTKAVTISKNASLTSDRIKYTGLEGGGTITAGTQSNNGAFSLWSSTDGEVRNVKLEKTANEARTINARLTEVEYNDSKGGNTTFMYDGNTLTSLTSISDVTVSGGVAVSGATSVSSLAVSGSFTAGGTTTVTGTLALSSSGNNGTTTLNADSTIGTISGSRVTVTEADGDTPAEYSYGQLVIGENATVTTAAFANAEYVLNGLSGGGTLKYTGSGAQLSLGSTLNKIDGHFLSQKTIEFAGTNAVSISGSVESENDIATLAGADVTVSGKMVSNGTLWIGHWGSGNSSVLNIEGELEAKNGVTFRQSGSVLNVKSDDVTIGTAGKATKIKRYDTDAAINITAGKTLNVVDSTISGITFATAAEAAPAFEGMMFTGNGDEGEQTGTQNGALDITAGAVLSGTVSKIDADAADTVPSIDALMSASTLKNTDVVITATDAITTAAHAAQGGYFGETFVLNIMSGVTLDAAADFSLALKGMENFSNIVLHCNVTGADAVSLNGTEIAGGASDSIAFTGAPIAFASTNGTVVNVWATFTVPEPTSSTLSVLALAALAARRRRKK